ncbi:unnamed protein product [Rhizophagus irregularis]|uniref:Uncharacterized protein n=2 Tax=Rhizophagus irregularis TaxID=588596 RepID=A0A916E8W6_9GLOM|nr:unnamed protein product [Rhizophagus irregularis]CAB5371632.1 unnamed protein product [Rhizophagus irregularis]
MIFRVKAKMTTIPQQLGFDGEETKVFNELTGRERRAFDALPDNNSKIHFIRGMVVKERSWREKSRLRRFLTYLFR